MEVYHSLEEYRKGPRAVATIGTFDGVHLGHRKILKRLTDNARELHAESVVLSLHPHPRLVLYPEDNPLRLLQTIDEKIEKLADQGIDKLLLIPFTREFSRTTSETFIQEILVGTVGIDRIVIGYDHHFGKNRTGGLEELRRGAGTYGFSVEEIPARQVDNANVSSTKIRNALIEGDVDAAGRFLGYRYPLSGTVIKGEQLGRKLGYPTANLYPDDPYKLIPAKGVYLVDTEVDGEHHYGMLNIGTKPTVGDFELGLEVNILDFDRDIYGRKLTLHFIHRIRDEVKFNSLDELVSAIDSDKAVCLDLISQLG